MRAPEPLDEDVVKHPAPSVQADSDSAVFQFPVKGLAGELRSMDVVEDVRNRDAKGFLQGVQSELDI